MYLNGTDIEAVSDNAMDGQWAVDEPPLRTWGPPASPILTAFDALNQAACVCRPDGVIIGASQAARGEIGMEEWIRSARGRLKAASDESDAALQSAIRWAGRCNRAWGGAALFLRHRTSAALARVEVARMPADSAATDEPTVLFAMTRRSTPGFAELLRSLGLTESEVEVADLAAQGLASPAIARLRKVSLATVRSQLAGAFQKLGAHNRVELVNLLQGRQMWTSQ